MPLQLSIYPRQRENCLENDQTAEKDLLAPTGDVALVQHGCADELERGLFSKIAQGDEMAFRRLFQLYGPIIGGAIRKVTRCEAVVSDILQDVFLKLWLKKEQLEAIEHPRRWVLQIAYHESFNWLKRRKVAQKHIDVLMEIQTELVSDENEIELQVYYKETAGLLHEVVCSLPPKAQKVYRLSREEGLRIAEIAEELRLSSQTVKNTLGRAIRSIRLKMGDLDCCWLLLLGYCFFCK